jgi:hypothetical protein
MMAVSIGSLESRPLRYVRQGAQRACQLSLFLLERADEIVWYGIAISVAFFLVAYVALLGDELLVLPTIFLCIHVLWHAVTQLTDNQLVFPGVLFLCIIGAIGVTNGLLQPPLFVTLALAVAVALPGVLLLMFIWPAFAGPTKRKAAPPLPVSE